MDLRGLRALPNLPIPPNFVRALGYLGSERYVAFYMDPLGSTLRWIDQKACGVGKDVAWTTYRNHGQVKAVLQPFDFGEGEFEATYWLLYDRESRQAYAGQREVLVRQFRGGQPESALDDEEFEASARSLEDVLYPHDQHATAAARERREYQKMVTWLRMYDANGGRP